MTDPREEIKRLADESETAMANLCCNEVVRLDKVLKAKWQEARAALHAAIDAIPQIAQVATTIDGEPTAAVAECPWCLRMLHIVRPWSKPMGLVTTPQGNLTDAALEGACPLCSGDCSSANPPVLNCPMRGDFLSPAEIEAMVGSVFGPETRSGLTTTLGKMKQGTPMNETVAVQCLRDALKDVEAVGVALPRHGIDVLGYFINRLNARQAEPVAWLEDLIEMAQEHADHFSAAYAGYKPDRHAHHAAVLKQARTAMGTDGSEKE